MFVLGPSLGLGLSTLWEDGTKEASNKCSLRGSCKAWLTGGFFDGCNAHWMPLGRMLYTMVPLYGDFGERYTILFCEFVKASKSKACPRVLMTFVW